MANHVITLISPSEDILGEYLNEEGDFDFEKILPGPARDDDMFPNKGEVLKDGVVLYDITGYCRLDWNRENWGTKWNSYQTKKVEAKVVFGTPWSHPRPIVAKLSELHPEVSFFVKYSDEDGYGSNHGVYTIKAGEVTGIPCNKEEIHNELWES